MDSLFRAAKQNRIFEDVVEQIQGAIIEGRIKVGEKLPPERELKEMLKTSRSTLREALRVLEQKGLIEVKLGMGGGTVVKSVSYDQIAESFNLLIRSQKVPLRYLAEFRERVDGDVMELAALRADKDDIIILRNLLADAKVLVDKGLEFINEFWKVDKNIHLYFAQITKNPIYISIYKTIQNNLVNYYKKYLHMEHSGMEENYNDLCVIVDAVEKGQKELARKLTQEHVQRFSQYMSENNKSL